MLTQTSTDSTNRILVEPEKDIIQKQTSIGNEDLSGKLKKFFTKYFCQGQKLSKKQALALEQLDEKTSWQKRLMVKHRQEIGMLIPFVLLQTIWWCLATKHDFFKYFNEVQNPKSGIPNYYLSFTMILGACVAGMTSEGGGAVAFPVMTLLLKIDPKVARDFSLMVQSVGMSAASFTIFWMKIKLEKHSIIYCSIGAFFGMIFGLEVLDSLPKEAKKLGFVSIWFSFCAALFLLNREKKRKTYDSIQNFGTWQAVSLVLTGFLGGIFSGVTGSGVDICSFSILSLLFRISEKISTPTSIVLMAINSLVGVFWRGAMEYPNGIDIAAWKYLAVVVPIIVFFAPLGSLLSSYFHRQVLAALVYVLDTVALITAIAVIPIFQDLRKDPDPEIQEKNVWPWGLIMVPSLIVGGFLFFFCLSKVGERLMRKIELEATCSHPKIDQIEKGSDQNSIETLDIIPEKIEFENDLQTEKTEVDNEIPEKIEAEKMDIENSVQPLEDSPSI